MLFNSHLHQKNDCIFDKEKNKQRQKEGIEAARRAGKQLGPPFCV